MKRFKKWKLQDYWLWLRFESGALMRCSTTDSVAMKQNMAARESLMSAFWANHIINKTKLSTTFRNHLSFFVYEYTFTKSSTSFGFELHLHIIEYKFTNYCKNLCWNNGEIILFPRICDNIVLNIILNTRQTTTEGSLSVWYSDHVITGVWYFLRSDLCESTCYIRLLFHHSSTVQECTDHHQSLHIGSWCYYHSCSTSKSTI